MAPLFFVVKRWGLRRLIAGLAVLVAVTGLTLAASPGAAHALPAPGAAEVQFLTLLNQARTAKGLAALARDGALDGIARLWSTHMATTFAGNGGVTVDATAPNDCDRSALCHRPDLRAAVDAVAPNWLGAGENISVGGDVPVMHNGLLSSTAHRANILGDYDRVGVGVVAVGTRLWVTFDFVRGPAPATPAPAATGAASPVIDPASTTGITALATDGRFTAATPERLVDTRSGLGAAAGTIAAGGTLAVAVAGSGQVPADATGVVVNVTATGAASDGYLTIYPCGGAPPSSSTLNFTAGANVPNLATSGLGTDGTLCVYANVTSHVLIDLAGWYRTGAGAAFVGQAPARLLDTRSTGRPDQTFTLNLRGNVSSDTSAVVVNLTATEPAAAGYVTAYACGGVVPATSNVNFTAGASVPNAAVVPLAADGTICFAASAPTHLIVDVAGSFGGQGATLTAVIPARLLDTRAGTGGWMGRVGAGQSIDLPVAGRAGVPDSTRSAVFNVTVTQPDHDGFLTVYPCGTPVPVASNLNFTAGETRANQVTVDLGVTGRACFYASSPTMVIADLTAFLSQ